MKTLEQRNDLKAQFRAWKEEIALWQEHAPSFRHHNPADYQRLKAIWQETKDEMVACMESCVKEAKS
jgi:hypothetical protein